MTNELTQGQQVKVNGKRYTVEKAGECGADLVGPRGGHASVVQNIHSGRWTLIHSATARAEAVTSIEVA